MITADKIKTLIDFTPISLAKLLADSGYKGASFKSSKFLGMTNGGQFCYGVVYFDELVTGKDQTGKVYVTYNHENDTITADY